MVGIFLRYVTHQKSIVRSGRVPDTKLISSANFQTSRVPPGCPVLDHQPCQVLRSCLPLSYFHRSQVPRPH
jgi:hypothetical protein